ncbi:unnamed protein product [Cuscuta epithymum]|uniref:Uncharacterized protein n=1 Tax=Cuscuta epithymum TaxID=186058 RepID=A0AAV0D9W7_9ASTE|nr:unnamed protein product [Cuscuta epithymum]
MIQRERKSQPRRESILSIVYVHPLRPSHRRGVEVVVQSDRVVEDDDVAEVELVGEDGSVRALGRPDDGRRGVGGVLAVVDYVVEEEHELLAWLVWPFRRHCMDGRNCE